MDKRPEFPEELVPVSTAMPPLTPFTPLFAVDTVTWPLEVRAPYPVNNNIEPPEPPAARPPVHS